MSRRQQPGYYHPGGRPPPPARRPRLPDLRDCDIIDMDDGHVLEDFPPAAAGGAGGRAPARGGQGGRGGAASGGRPPAREGRGGGGQGEVQGPWHRAFEAILGFTYPCPPQRRCYADGECDRGFVRDFLLKNAFRCGYRGPRHAPTLTRFMRPYGEELVEELQDYLSSLGADLILGRGGVAATRDRRTGRLLGDNRRGRGGVGGGAGGGGGGRDPRGMGPRMGMEMRRGYGY